MNNSGRFAGILRHTGTEPTHMTMKSLIVHVVVGGSMRFRGRGQGIGVSVSVLSRPGQAY